jgi:ParB-like chromosome segregation protein Spo0J
VPGLRGSGVVEAVGGGAEMSAKTNMPDVMYFDPDNVKPNPWQPRDHEDPEHICKIAESIYQDGLMQIPVGRTAENYVELAFGHTRWKAFQLLHNIAMYSTYNSYDLTNFPILARYVAAAVANKLATGDRYKFRSFPVVIRKLTDEEMFRLAISENISRKDLTAIEEARAMSRYRIQFGKTSVEIGALFGLGESAVRNKIRLLDLPDHLRAGLETGAMTEGAARELLILLDLPEEIRKEADRSYPEYLRPSAIEKSALNGTLAATIHAWTSELVERHSEDLSKAPWKWSESILAGGEDEVSYGPCTGCQYNVLRDKHNRCINPVCFRGKRNAWRMRYARIAAEAVGYPAVQRDGGNSETIFYLGAEPQKALKLAIQVKCPNLAVFYSEYDSKSNCDALNAEGYPNAQLLCTKRKGFCTCTKASENGVELRPVAIVPMEQTQAVEEERVEVAEPTPAREPVAEAPIAKDELKDIDRKIREKKRTNAFRSDQLRGWAADRLAEGLLHKNKQAWKLLLAATRHSPEIPGGQVEDLILAVGRIMTYYIAMGFENPDPVEDLKKYNAFMLLASLPEIELDEAIDKDGKS